MLCPELPRASRHTKRSVRRDREEDTVTSSTLQEPSSGPTIRDASRPRSGPAKAGASSSHRGDAACVLTDKHIAASSTLQEPSSEETIRDDSRYSSGPMQDDALHSVAQTSYVPATWPRQHSLIHPPQEVLSPMSSSSCSPHIVYQLQFSETGRGRPLELPWRHMDLSVFILCVKEKEAASRAILSDAFEAVTAMMPYLNLF